MALTTFTSGTGIASSPMNANFIASGKIQEIYTGTGFDSERLDAAGDGTTENSYEFTAISAADLGNADYLIVEATLQGKARMFYLPSGDGTKGSFKIQTKDTGGSYSDSLAYTDVVTSWLGSNNTGVGINDVRCVTVKWIHTLTANEKTNGVQVKIFSKSVLTSTSSQTMNIAVSNIQTVISTGV